MTTIPAESDLRADYERLVRNLNTYALDLRRMRLAPEAAARSTAGCSEAGHTALPASAETIAAFIDAMAALKAPATVRRYVSSVATFHRAAGVANPCSTLAVKLALKRMHRERGRAQAQAAPVNDVLVARMLAAAGDTLRHRRNRALLAVAYSTLVPPLGTGRPAPRGSADRCRRLRHHYPPTQQDRPGRSWRGGADRRRRHAASVGLDRRPPASPTGRCSAPC